MCVYEMIKYININDYGIKANVSFVSFGSKTLPNTLLPVKFIFITHANSGHYHCYCPQTSQPLWHILFFLLFLRVV